MDATQEDTMSLDILPAFSLDFDPAALLTVESGDNDEFLRWLESEMVPDENPVEPADAGGRQLPVDGDSVQAFGLESSMTSAAIPIKQEPVMQLLAVSSGPPVLATYSFTQEDGQPANVRTHNDAGAPLLSNIFNNNQAPLAAQSNMVQQQQQQPQQQVVQGFPLQPPTQQLYAGQAWLPPFMQQFQQQDSRPFVFQGVSGPAGLPPAPAPAPGPPDPPKKLGPARRFRERQKAQISSLEAEVMTKLAELQVLEAKNALLKRKSKVLEAAVASREHAVEMLSRHGPPSFDSLDPGVVPAPPAHLISAKTALVAGLLPKAEDATAPADAAANTAAVVAVAAVATARAQGEGVQEGGGGEREETTPRSSGSSGEAVDSGNSPKGVSDGYSGPGRASDGNGVDGGLYAGATTSREKSSSSCGTALGSGGGPATEKDLQGIVDALTGKVGTGAAAAGATGEAPAEACSSACVGCPDGDESRCAQNIKHMSVTQIKDHWKSFLQDISSLLLAAPKSELEDKRCPLAHPAGNMPELPVGCISTDSCSGPSCKTSGASTGGAAAAATAGATVGRSSSVGADGQRRPPGMRCPTNRKLDALVRKYLYLCKFVGLFNPGALYQLHAIDLENGRSGQVPDGDHWRKVVGYLELTSEQVSDLLAHTELYRSKLGEVLEQRVVLQQQLMLADNAQQQCKSQLYGCDGQMAALEVLDLLNKNLKKEYTLGCMLGCVCWGRVLTGYQFAKAAFYSYPYFPDTHSMMAVMYEDYSHLGGVEIFGTGGGIGGTGGGVDLGNAVSSAAGTAAKAPARRGKRNSNTSNTSSSSPTYGHKVTSPPPSFASGGTGVSNGNGVSAAAGGGNGFYMDLNQPPQQQYSQVSMQQYSQMLPPPPQQQQQYLQPVLQQYSQPVLQQYSQPVLQQYSQPQQQYGQPLMQQYGRQLSGGTASGSLTSHQSINSSGSYTSAVPTSWQQAGQGQQGLPGAAPITANAVGRENPPGLGNGNGAGAGYMLQSPPVQPVLGNGQVNGQLNGMVGGSGDAGAVQGVYERWVSGV